MALSLLLRSARLAQRLPQLQPRSRRTLLTSLPRPRSRRPPRRCHSRSLAALCSFRGFYAACRPTHSRVDRPTAGPVPGVRFVRGYPTLLGQQQSKRVEGDRKDVMTVLVDVGHPVVPPPEVTPATIEPVLVVHV